jgi:hypothetical protein
LVGLAPRFRRRCRIRWLSRIAASSGYPDLLVPSGQGFSPVSRETFERTNAAEVFLPFGCEPGSTVGSPPFDDPVTSSREAPKLPRGSRQIHPYWRPAQGGPRRIPRPGTVQTADDVLFPLGSSGGTKGQRDGYFIPRGAPRSHRAGRALLSGKSVANGRGWAGSLGDAGSHGGSGQALGLPLITSPRWTYSHRNDHSRAGESQEGPPGPLASGKTVRRDHFLASLSVTDSVGCHLPPVIRGLIDRTARTPYSLPGDRLDPHDDVPRGTGWVGWSTPGFPHGDVPRGTDRVGQNRGCFAGTPFRRGNRSGQASRW